MIDGPESINSPEEVLEHCRESIQQLIDTLNRQIETAKSNETESGEAQVREQINSILCQSLEQLGNKQFDGCVSSLIDASDYAYQQSSLPGFEKFESISDQIDKAIKMVKNLSASL